MSSSGQLPGKLDDEAMFHSIGDVADAFGIEHSTLRYWEEEFDVLNPSTTPGGQRRYDTDDVKCIQRIVHLLRSEKYTIEGARQKLNSDADTTGTTAEEIIDICDKATNTIEDYKRSISDTM